MGVTPTTYDFTLEDRYTRSEGQVFLTGMAALVRVLLDQQRADRAAGLDIGTLVSGYPGSPIGGLDGELHRHRRYLQDQAIRFVPGLNEDLAATAVFGAQLAQAIPGAKHDGVVGMWYGKAPGVDRSIDAFRHGVFRGMAPNGALVAVAGDDPAPKSSIVPNDSQTLFYDLMMPTVYPADVQDVVDLGLHAFALSRLIGNAVGLKVVSEVADSAGTAIVGPGRVQPVLPTIEVDGRPYAPDFVPNRVGAGNREVERLMLAGRLALASAYGRENNLNPIVGARTRARIALVAAGKTYLDLREALHRLGLDDADLAEHGVRVMRVGLLYPMDPRDLRELAEGVDEVLVVEEKRPFLERFLKDALFDAPVRPRVLGKADGQGRPLVPAHGALSADDLVPLLAARIDAVLGTDRFTTRATDLARRPEQRPELQIVRKGHFCSGCPHTTSLQTPDGATVGGGIGCHTMALHKNRPEYGAITGVTQMGGEGAQWVGAAPFTDTGHFFQNLGDGTFAHSGSMAIRFAVSAGINVTYKLLFNSAVAMTGGQDIAGGKTLADTVRLLQSEGVRKIIVTSEDPKRHRGLGVPVRDRSEILDVQRELREVPGVTVLIHDQQCAIEKRRMRKRGTLEEPPQQVVINERVCEGCGDCGEKSSCLSVMPVDTEFGRKTRIHQSSCTKDFSCMKGDCPSFVTVVPGQKVRRTLPEMPPVELLDPEQLFSADDFELHISGIGGTGVVTVNQILGVAAAATGRHVRALDQFGSSQKAGAVTSNLKISSEPLARSATVSRGGADVLLVFDVLTATEPQNLAKANPSRTVAVVSTDQVATGDMIVNAALSFPAPPVFVRSIDANTRAERNVYVDAKEAAEALLGNHLATNMFLVGVAYQQGALPLPVAAIEHAIRLNGVAVEMNLAALRWGRIAVAAPAEVTRAMRAEEPVVEVPVASYPELTGWATGELRRLLEVRVPELVDYQDRAYAEHYVAEVRRVASTGHLDVAEAVARGLHKLMAYKDEYEVARLHLAERDRIVQEFGEGATVQWHLHPPVLRYLGMDRKIALGKWFTPAFAALRGMRRVRGTKLDVFGYAGVRRTERRLVQEYRSMLVHLLPGLNAVTAPVAVELAALPDVVRGYEEIKLANVEAYETRRAELLRRYDDVAAQTAMLAG